MQKAGRCGFPYRTHSLLSVRLAHRTLAGLPFGMFGIAVAIEGAIQHAPHFLQAMGSFMAFSSSLGQAAAAFRGEMCASRHDLDQESARAALGRTIARPVRDADHDGGRSGLRRRPQERV